MIALLATIAGPTWGRVLGQWQGGEAALYLACALAAIVYCAAAVRARDWSWWRAASFVAGLAALVLALGSWIDVYADYLLSMHMVEHMLILLAAPPLILAGTPLRLALRTLPTRHRRALARFLHQRVVRIVTHPLVGLTAFVIVVSGSQIPWFFDLTLRDPIVHACEHAAYFWSAMIFFAPLIDADPLPSRLAPLARFYWLMAAMTPMAVLGAFMAFSTHVWYSPYVQTARELGRSALSDQHEAGVVMAVFGGTAMGALALVLVMGAMIAEERRQRQRDLYADARNVELEI